MFGMVFVRHIWCSVCGMMVMVCVVLYVGSDAFGVVFGMVRLV